MLDAISRTRKTLSAAYRLSLRAQRAVGGWRLAGRCLGLLLAVMAFDLFFPLPVLLRAAWVFGLLAWAVLGARALRTQARAEEIRLERAARLLEDRHPEIENALINAVQFSAQVAAHPDDPAAPLMRREMARAEQEAERLPADSAVDRAAIARARRPLLALGALLLLTILFVPRVWRFEAPRFFAFWSDPPPFTLTDFRVTPQRAHVRVGGSVAVTVQVGGLLPETLSLVTRSGHGSERIQPLYAADGHVYQQTLDNLTEDTDFYVRADTGRSARYRIRVDQAPRARAVRVTLRPPAYTKRPDETLTPGEEGIRGLFGTQVEVEVEATRPLESGRLLLRFDGAPEEVVALAPEPGRPERARGAFTLRREGRYQISLTAGDGLATPDAARGVVHLLRDEKPLVYVTAPGMNAVITPDMAVPVRVEAEDDVSVQRVELHRSVNNMAESVQTFPVPVGQRRADAAVRLDFRDLGARPGDVIQYYATAYDNDPGKPNLADSERYWLWIVSQEDYRRLLAQQRGLPQLAADYRAQTDALQVLAAAQRELAGQMAQLAQRPTPDAQRPTPSDQRLRQSQRALRQQAQEQAQAMRRLAAQKPQYDIEKGLQKQLKALARQVEQAAKGPMQGAVSAPTAARMAQQGEQAAQKLELAAGQGQRSVEKALRAMEKLAPLYQDVARLKELAQRQGDMAMQARQIARQVRPDRFSQSRLSELAQQQEQARASLHQIQQDLHDHAEACRGLAPGAAQQAVRLAETLEQKGIGDVMRSAERAFRAPDAPTGADQAERAQRSLEDLFRQGQACQGGAKQGLDSQSSLCLGQGAGNTLDQLSRNMGPAGPGGQGQGTARGQGGQPAPQPGTRPGDGSPPGGGQPQAMALTMRQQQAGSSLRRESRRHMPGADLPGALGRQDVERLAGAPRPPSAVTDSSSGRYPVEYRQLVKEYFKAVAGGK